MAGSHEEITRLLLQRKSLKLRAQRTPIQERSEGERKRELKMMNVDPRNSKEQKGMA